MDTLILFRRYLAGPSRYRYAAAPVAVPSPVPWFHALSVWWRGPY